MTDSSPFSSSLPLRNSCGVALALLSLLTGCGKGDLAAYRVPKEKDATLPVTVAAGAMPATAPAGAAAPAPGGMAGTPVAVASGPGLAWTAPAGWQAIAPGGMRKGSFTITGEGGATADLSITAFPGAVGGELANVNRWRGQLSLPPVAEADLPKAVTRLSQNGLTFTVVDLVSADPAQPQGTLGAMTPHDGAMWFFKLSGPAPLIAASKPAFIEFLKTVEVAAP